VNTPVLRTAIIGCGRMGASYVDDPGFAGIYTHAGAYRACAGVELAALCDRDPDQLRRAGERWQVAALYSDADRMLDEVRPELVSVCTPDSTHYDVIRAATAAPGVRGILAEKPLATSTCDARALVDLARQKGVRLAVNYSRRYCRRHRELAAWVHAGGMGRVRLATGYYTKGTRHNGTHWLDLVRWLLGSPVRVAARNRLGEGGDDPTLDVTLTFSNAATAELCACPASDYTIFELDLLGETGRARITEGGRRMDSYRVIDGVPTAGYRGLVLHESRDDGLRDMTLAAVQDLVEAVLNDHPLCCTGEDGLAALALAEAAHAAAVAGVPAELSE